MFLVILNSVLEKVFLNQALSRLQRGGLAVTYWDGETRRYGPEKPWLTMTIRDPRVVKAMRRDAQMAVSEGYMDGQVELSDDFAKLARLATLNHESLQAALPLVIKRTDRGPRSPQGEAANVQHHYDLGNEFYKLWLDENLTYSCAYFKTKRDSLERAQRQKIDHTLRKLALKPGMRLLDIGSGWGHLLFRAAERYGAKAHGVTLSREQFRRTTEEIKRRKLGRQVTVELKHYAELADPARYDRVVSVGMYEHVGQKNHQRYFATVDRVLKPGGVSLLHTITQHIQRPMSPWITKYIFPGGYIPSLEETIDKLPGHDFHAIDIESLRRHYALTLDEWSRRFERQSAKIAAMYDERFVRMWRLYLRGSYAGFAYDNLDLHQILFSKGLTDDFPLTRDFIYR